MARILVTGATGQVGRRFVPRLARWAGADAVRVLVRDAARAEALARLGVELVEGDLRDADVRARALVGADSVVNVAAAFRGVPDAEAFQVNRDAAVELARQALTAGVTRFVQTSTNLVYAGGLGRPAQEDDELAPGPQLGAYAASKAQAELAMRELDPALGLTVVRPAFVYGEGDSHLRDAVQRAATWPAHKRLPVVHHADVSLALWRALSTPHAAGRAYNVMGDAPISAFELHQRHGVPQPADAVGRVDGDPWQGVVSTARIRAELGWRPLFPSVWTARDAGAL
ncbi:NAD-dependent epimerase/dehydratase family protein [Kitasatospora sp. RB6PN24]|uniref:NAD-dependent epimerase/dehydratase family protein n=1 Tax=Kitasatospora humi TaxID=2893891 RepID=UPI001E355DA1|nr:NAD-dependent epimerase/dehydratase family protein [Kitasatospora humi]MCC9305926.1 NAD-dependent epimerase/dehydratase family protein [Kitasatospora humi]